MKIRAVPPILFIGEKDGQYNVNEARFIIKDILNDFENSIDLIIDGGFINGSGSKIFLLDNDVWKQLR